MRPAHPARSSAGAVSQSFAVLSPPACSHERSRQAQEKAGTNACNHDFVHRQPRGLDRGALLRRHGLASKHFSAVGLLTPPAFLKFDAFLSVEFVLRAHRASVVCGCAAVLGLILPPSPEIGYRGFSLSHTNTRG